MGFRNSARSKRECQYTRYIDYCQKLNLDDQSIGNQKFGQAEVDCGFRTSETKWGRVNGEDIGIIYLDLRLSQTSDHILKYAEVHMTFRPVDVSSGSTPTVVKYHTPKELFGPERTKHIENSAELNPSFSVPVGTFSIGKMGRSSTQERPYKWMFTGELSPGQDGPYYQKVLWKWQASQLEPQAQVRRVHLAVAIRHASLPFSIEVAMNGKLDKLLSRAHFAKREARQLALVTPKLLLEDLIFKTEDIEAEIANRNKHLSPGFDAKSPENPPPDEKTTTPSGVVELDSQNPVLQAMLPLIMLIHILWVGLSEGLIRLSRLVDRFRAGPHALRPAPGVAK